MKHDGYLMDSAKEAITRSPLYSNMAMCPLKYHGYKETTLTIGCIIEELKYELSIYPEYSDILLDHLSNMIEKLNKL